MTDAYLYSPVSGQVSNMDPCQCCGCPTCSHTACNGGGQMVDITGGFPSIALVVSGTCKSAKFFVFYACCSGSQDEWGQVVKADLWSQQNATGIKIGTVLFGHVKFPQVTNNQIFNFVGAPGTKQIGSRVTGLYPGCYTGEHVHLEKWGGSRLISCGANVSQGLQAIYKWTF